VHRALPAPRPVARPSALLLLLLAAVAGRGAAADVLTTTEGLVLEGEVERGADGVYRIRTTEGEIVLPAARVAAVREGEGARAGLLDGADAAGWFRLALEAEAAGLPDLAREAHQRVVAVEPGHPAARRALGEELVDGVWVSEALAHRRRGLVLFRGRWLLPAQVESEAAEAERSAEESIATPADELRTREVIRTLATGGPVLERAARLALASAPRERRLAATLGTLYDRDPRVRAASATLLGELGDEAALRPLILSAARDLDPDVRLAALRAAASFGHDDTPLPFVRALGSQNPRLVANAAAALAELGDERAAHYLVKRLTSHGYSARNFVAFTNQVSYVRDYDVEIAQASNIANPDVATIIDGVILDVKVLDASVERVWVERVLVDSLSRLAGRPFRGREDALAWYAAKGDALPEYPTAAEGRPPRRREGKVIGAR
jgi:hypothetical protein